MNSCNLWCRYCYYFHFIDDVTEVQRGEVNLLKVTQLVNGRARFQIQVDWLYSSWIQGLCLLSSLIWKSSESECLFRDGIWPFYFNFHPFSRFDGLVHYTMKSTELCSQHYSNWQEKKKKTVSAFYTVLELLSFEECIYSYYWKYRASAASESNLSHSAILNL